MTTEYIPRFTQNIKQTLDIQNMFFLVYSIKSFLYYYVYTVANFKIFK